MARLPAFRIVAEQAERLARAVPVVVVESLAERLGRFDLEAWQTDQPRSLEELAHPHYRGLVAEFLRQWREDAAEVSPESVSMALLTAVCGETVHRESHSVELVWTGPDVGVVPLRRTEQALLQVLDSATARLLVVSYAVYRIPRVCDALVRAADRGVAIQFVVETPDRLEVQRTARALAALGPAVASRCRVYFWPPDSREKDDAGKSGVLHVKCAVADGRSLFLSSANLTEFAFTLNMELGVLIIGSAQPAQVEQQFDEMIRTGRLVGS